MARHDPHSYADLAQGRVRSVHLALRVDFPRRVLEGEARLDLAAPGAGPLDLDTRGLQLLAVHDGAGRPLDFDLAEPDLILGQRLRVQRTEPIDRLVLRYRTSPEASGLMWLEPVQTAGGAQPFLLSQCQAIHARSLAPLQDTPAARMVYSARITTPVEMSVVMSAAPGRVVAQGAEVHTHFEMPQPIPPYLLALAVGELASRDLGPRTRVWAEPPMIEAAAWEFEDVERMLEAGEALFGPYPWERYDFIVLPPSFPMGGMENPRMTFLTPTLLAGDRSLVGVLAHELAHSWTGNLVTNATNEDFWLNEGWTVYAERRILEALYGAEAAAEAAVLGRVVLEHTLRERTLSGRSTALCYGQRGCDPDEEFSSLPYEKGFLLVTALERSVGRERFDRFIRRYLEVHRFSTLSTAEFADFVRSELPEAELDLEEWLYGEGLPEDAPRIEAPRLAALQELAQSWPEGAPESVDWSPLQQRYFLSQLPRPQTPASAERVARLLGLRETGNAELRAGWLALAAAAGVPGIEPELVDFLDTVGRTKLLKPVVHAMNQRPELRELAIARVQANRPRWHSSTRLALDDLLAR